MEAPGGVAPPELPRLAGEALLLGQGAVTVRTMPFAPRAVKPHPVWAQGYPANTWRIICPANGEEDAKSN